MPDTKKNVVNPRLARSIFPPLVAVYSYICIVDRGVHSWHAAAL